MSWVNLDDVYVNKTGDTIAGDLSVGGALTINDGKGTDTTYNVANEITTLRDSVTQTTELLWQGSIHESGSAVVSSNLSKHKLLGFKFNLSPNIAIAKASQQQVTDVVKYNWGIRAAEANFTIRGNTITFSGISFAQFVCNHLGESLVFNAGDATNITEIWGL